MKLSIIILNYNTPGLVYDCLKSIKEHEPSFDYEVIIVDNSSEDKKAQDSQIKKILLSTFYFLLSTPNRGFGAGNNAGAKVAKGEYLFLLNPDTVLTEDSISKMIGFIEKHKEIGALTCLLGPDKKTLQKNFFGKFQSLAGLTIRRYNYQTIDRSKEFFYSDIVTGAALMIKRELFEKVKGFDERFFMYLEDDDLCKRLVDAGYKNAVLLTTKIIHLEGKSISKNSKRKKIYYESQALYWNKHNGSVPTFLMKVVRFPMKIIKSNK